MHVNQNHKKTLEVEIFDLECRTFALEVEIFDLECRILKLEVEIFDLECFLASADMC